MTSLKNFHRHPKAEKLLPLFSFQDESGVPIQWVPFQMDIIEAILDRKWEGKRRLHISAATQSGKSSSVAAGITIRTVIEKEPWAIVAANEDKANIIMSNIIRFATDSPVPRKLLDYIGPIDKLRRERNRRHIVFRGRGAIRTFTADVKNTQRWGQTLLGFGCIPEGYKVLTDKGEIEIRDLVENKRTDKVWSFNHSTNSVELKNILSYQDNPLGEREIYEITIGRKKFQCTEDHPVWVEGKGYIKAKDLRIGDIVWSYKKISLCLLSVKSVLKNFRERLLTLREFPIIFVADNVGEYSTEAKETQDGNLLSPVKVAGYSLREKGKSFVRRRVWDYLIGALSTAGLFEEKSTLIGEGITSPIRVFTPGLLGPSVGRPNVSIAERMRRGRGIFTGRIKAESIDERKTIGCDSAHHVTRNTIRKIKKVLPKKNRVYNLAVAENENYFINGYLLHNSPNVVEDDSSLIPDPAHAQVMRMLGGRPDSFLIKIGNPFYRNHFLKSFESDRYAKIVVDCYQAMEEGRFSKEFIEEMREEPFFDILYECKFPEEDLADSKGWVPLFSEGDIFLAQQNIEAHAGEGRIGVDVAASGENESVIVYRSRKLAEVLFRSKKIDTMDLVSHIQHWMGEKKVPAEQVFIDTIGVGAGVYDRMKQLGLACHDVNVQRTPLFPNKFSNIRAEAYWGLKDWIRRGGKLIPSGQDSWKQLKDIRYKANNQGKIQIISKDQLRSQGVHSPDLADSIMLTFARPEMKFSFKPYKPSMERLAKLNA